MPMIRQELINRGLLSEFNIYGFVTPDGKLSHSMIRDGKGTWERTSAPPSIYLPIQLELLVTDPRRFNVIYGGRGSAKSIGCGDIALGDAQDTGSKTYCLREFQSSIKNSMHSLLKEEIERLDLDGFLVNQQAISFRGKEAFEFAGLLRNTESIKSSFGFKRFLVEEGQNLSKASLKELTPTARRKPNRGLPGSIGDMVQAEGVGITFILNPASSEDPMSQRFLLPFLEELEENGGIYQDDLHLIIKMNYRDNPWFHESGLEEERRWDFINLPRAEYDHIWLGAFNDSVESALIMAEWFDACIDSHKRLGFEPKGAKIGSHDCSDMGDDSKGYAMRHGSVLLRLEEKKDGNVNEGGHWAAGLAIQDGVDAFSWDGTGMGAGLAEQMGQDFNGKNITLSMFVYSAGVDNPDAIYKPAKSAPVQNQRKNKDTFKSLKPQYYWDLRDRIYRTYRAVIFDEYHDPDTLISFSSEIELLSKLRAELCRMPVKPNGNGFNELWDKPTMKSKFKIASPNLGDSVMQTMRYRAHTLRVDVHIPRAIRPMRNR